MQYEWDEEKRTVNLRKHGVDFPDAVIALEDPMARTIEDSGSKGEMRFITLGYGPTGVLYVVWTERDGNVIRIISARKASPGESSQYHGQQQR